MIRILQAVVALNCLALALPALAGQTVKAVSQIEVSSPSPYAYETAKGQTNAIDSIIRDCVSNGHTLNFHRINAWKTETSQTTERVRTEGREGSFFESDVTHTWLRTSADFECH